MKYFVAGTVMACLWSAPESPRAGGDRSGSTSTHARGTFDVKLTPQDDKTDDPVLARMTIDKVFHGDIEGTSKGQMLAANTEVKGSAGYVAIERIAAVLNGRRGTFVLQHNATMTRGKGELQIVVLPDSGMGELAGLTGRMDITITDGKHFYDFEYELPK